MMLAKLNSRLCATNYPLSLCRRLESVVSPASSEVMNTPVYPVIEDLSLVARTRKYKNNSHEAVKNCKTVEEKMIKVNIPRYYGFRCYMYEEGRISYNELSQAQYITRTHIVQDSKLPAYYDNLMAPEKFDDLVQSVTKSFQDAVAFEFESRSRRQEKTQEFLEDKKLAENMVADDVCKQVNRIIMTNLNNICPHLVDAHIDFYPRVEAFWAFAGLTPDKTILSRMKWRYWDELLDEPLDRPFQYIGSPTMHLRHKLPLNEILPMSECENPDLEVPVFKFDPRVIGHCVKRRHGTTVPGFWPGDANEFGLMSYHNRGYLSTRPSSFNDEPDALKTQAVLANYGWLFSQACNLGFSTYNDVTYPLVNQMIISNGQSWSFCAYQLNTTLVNGFNCDQNPKRNLCWITEPMKLFERVENEKLVGFNEDVLKNLLKFYINVPQERVGVIMKPYLGEVEKRVADYEDDDKRVWLENCYKHLMSNRPRHGPMPEMYHWQFIYKHLFKTRPMDKRVTPWDYGKNPYLRRLNEHYGGYVPKVLRKVPVTKNKQKEAKTYYP